MPQNNPNVDGTSKNLTVQDIPAGSSLAKELSVSYGDIDFVEASGEQFFWGQSIWGIARFGNNRGNVED
jgi:hypothetical protein